MTTIGLGPIRGATEADTATVIRDGDAATATLAGELPCADEGCTPNGPADMKSTGPLARSVFVVQRTSMRRTEKVPPVSAL